MVSCEQWVAPTFDAESWDTCVELWRLARYFGAPNRPASVSEERKFRLLVVAALRLVWAHIPNELRAVVEAIEQFADHQDSAQLRESHAVAERIFREGATATGNVAQLVMNAAGDTVVTAYHPRWYKFVSLTANLSVADLDREQVESLHLKLFRDIVPNPFHPLTLDPAWLTSDVLALAQGIYADRAFDRMPILADALQDAGCDNADVLTHCRGPGPHVRGCWVVDLVLGKT